jgi:hypothetical protein
MLFIVALKDIFLADKAEQCNGLVKYAINFILGFLFFFKKKSVNVIAGGTVRNLLSKLYTHALETFLEILIDE